MKISLITGITGQDGSYLAELLLSKNYKVYGLVRRCSTNNLSNLNNIIKNPNLIIKYGDLIDTSFIVLLLNSIINENKDFTTLEIYNLGAMSHVKVSFDMPEYTGNVDGLGVVRILETIKNLNIMDKVRFYQASTSELYGLVQEVPQTEKTPMYPRSPYAVAKLYGFWSVKNYRESYNMFASNGILYNHESSRRTSDFISRKITLGLSDIINNKLDTLIVGNLDAKRDWGHAKDYVYGMYLILQHDTPDDFILSSGVQYSVREFIELAFKIKNITIRWSGSGVSEIGYIARLDTDYGDLYVGKTVVSVSSEYFRPAEVDSLLGDCTKARTALGWKPTYDFEKLVTEMVNHDCK